MKSYSNNPLRGLLVLLCVAHSVNAAVTVYTDETAFLNALPPGSFFTESFDGETPGTIASLSYAQALLGLNIAPVSPGIGSNLYIYPVQGSPGDIAVSASSFAPVTPLIVTFTGAEPVTAFGGYFIGSDPAGNTVASSVNLSADIGGSTYSAPVINTPSSSSVFRGYITNSGSFNSFTFDDPAADFWGGLTSVTIGTTVPEPGVTLLITLAGVCFALQRRRM